MSEGDDAELCVVAMGGTDSSFFVVVESFDSTGKHSDTCTHVHNATHHDYNSFVAVLTF